MAKFIATAEFDAQEINSNNRSELVNPGDEVEIDNQETIDRLTANGWIKAADEPDVVSSEPTGAADGSVATQEPKPAPTSGGLTTASIAGDTGSTVEP